MKGKLIKRDESYWLYDEVGENIATSWGVVEGKKLSLKNCQAIERGYDLDELAKNYLLNKWLPNTNKEDRELWYLTNDWSKEVVKIIKSFYIELMGDKKFSEEQMRRAYLLGRGDESIVRELGASNKEKMQYSENLNQGFESFLSLQQTEWDVIVEMECVIGCQNLIINGENSVCCGDKKPKISEDGCLILKRI